MIETSLQSSNTFCFRNSVFLFLTTTCLAFEQDPGLTRKILSSYPNDLVAFERKAAEHPVCSHRIAGDWDSRQKKEDSRQTCSVIPQEFKSVG